MKRFFITAAAMATLAISLLMFPLVANADYSVLNGACGQAGASSASACSAQNTKSNPLVGATGTIHNVTLLIARVTGAVAVIMVIYAGFQMVIGGGDPSKIQTARQTLIYALVGICVILVGQTIIIFVIDRV